MVMTCVRVVGLGSVLDTMMSSTLTEEEEGDAAADVSVADGKAILAARVGVDGVPLAVDWGFD